MKSFLNLFALLPLAILSMEEAPGANLLNLPADVIHEIINQGDLAAILPLYSVSQEGRAVVNEYLRHRKFSDEDICNILANREFPHRYLPLIYDPKGNLVRMFGGCPEICTAALVSLLEQGLDGVEIWERSNGYFDLVSSKYDGVELARAFINNLKTSTSKEKPDILQQLLNSLLEVWADFQDIGVKRTKSELDDILELIRDGADATLPLVRRCPWLSYLLRYPKSGFGLIDILKTIKAVNPSLNSNCDSFLTDAEEAGEYEGRQEVIDFLKTTMQEKGTVDISILLSLELVKEGKMPASDALDIIAKNLGKMGATGEERHAALNKPYKINNVNEYVIFLATKREDFEKLLAMGFTPADLLSRLTIAGVDGRTRVQRAFDDGARQRTQDVLDAIGKAANGNLAAALNKSNALYEMIRTGRHVRSVEMVLKAGANPQALRGAKVHPVYIPVLNDAIKN